jgi:hypothetical protein
MAPERQAKERLPQDLGLPLDRRRLRVRIEVQVHPEDIASHVVGAADGGELDVAFVLAPRPIDHVVLSVDTDVEPRDREPAEQTPLPVARKG